MCSSDIDSTTGMSPRFGMMNRRLAASSTDKVIAAMPQRKAVDHSGDNSRTMTLVIGQFTPHASTTSDRIVR